MQKYLLPLLLLSSISCAQTPSHHASIEGTYDCTGTEIDAVNHFKCEATLKKTKETYASNVTCTDGSTYTSTGIYDPIKRSLSMVSVNPKDPKETGVAVIAVNENGSLNSVWTYLNETNLGHTHCLKRKV